ncbi:MAG TPA: ROK family glucokinase, partial [Actinomycetota bacterium]|nr:ROK family glucokinase [Actinomycetota bacterium]
MNVTDPGQALGLDVGGTKIAAFRVARDGSVLDRDTVPTPAEDPEATIHSMIDVAKRLLSPEVVAVGVGAAGLVDVSEGILRFAPNLAWRELPIAERMSVALGLPCQVDNDATAAAWGEYRFGAGRGYRHMLLVTVGTGIGGGIVAGRRLFRGAHGFAAEIGHIIVEPDGPLCGCGNRGCWEQVASGHAIGRLGRRAAAEHPRSLVTELAGGDPDRVTGTTVTEAAMRGDDVAIRILSEVGRRLGEGIAGLVNVLDPQVVVVGGGVIRAGDLLLDPARAACAEAVEGFEHRPNVPVVGAQLGNDAGAVGAATLALEEL